MNIRRKLVIALGAGALVQPLRSLAQPAAKVYRIGWLGTADASGFASRFDSLRQGLRERGYQEGRNLSLELRWANNRYESLQRLAAELVAQNVDVIVTHGTLAIRSVKQASQKIPIVMAVVGDPVATGLITSLAKPNGNVTGSAFFGPELAAKRMELLKEVFPRAKRVAVLLNPNNDSANVNAPLFQATQRMSKSLKLEVYRSEVGKPDDLSSAFSMMKTNRIEALVIPEDSLFGANLGMLAERAATHGMPAVGYGEFAEKGGLISYGPDFNELFRRAAYFVDRILKGAKPADLPVEQPTIFQLIVNMKTARALGLKIPNSILVRADRVIE